MNVSIGGIDTELRTALVIERILQTLYLTTSILLDHEATSDVQGSQQA